MLLGKRRRPPMKRTTSMKELAPDLMASEEPPMPSGQNFPPAAAVSQHQQMQNHAARQTCGPRELLAERKLSTNKKPSAAAPMIPPRILCRNSSDFSVMAGIETAPFLRSCGLCMRRLNPGCDIFMYRGEIAFCSLECRQQLINYDERKEKCSFSSMNKHSAPATSTSSDPAGAGEEVVVAA